MKANPYHIAAVSDITRGYVIEIGERETLITPAGRSLDKIAVAGVIERIYEDNENNFAVIYIKGLPRQGRSGTLKVIANFTYMDWDNLDTVPSPEGPRKPKVGDTVVVYGRYPHKKVIKGKNGPVTVTSMFMDFMRIVPPEEFIEFEAASAAAEARHVEEFLKAKEIYDKLGSGAKAKIQARKQGINEKLLDIIDAIMLKLLEQKEEAEAIRKLLEEEVEEAEAPAEEQEEQPEVIVIKK